METTVFTLIRRTITENRDNLSDSLAQGGASSFEEYCHMTGRYAAFTVMLEEVNELEKRFIAD